MRQITACLAATIAAAGIEWDESFFSGRLPYETRAFLQEPLQRPGVLLTSTADRNQLLEGHFYDIDYHGWFNVPPLAANLEFNSPILTLASLSSGLVYAGGAFTQNPTSGAALNGIMVRALDGTWGPVTTRNATVQGFNGIVVKLTTCDDVLYAGGQFTSDSGGEKVLNNIAKWNNVTRDWEPLGSGADNVVVAIECG